MMLLRNIIFAAVVAVSMWTGAPKICAQDTDTTYFIATDTSRPSTDYHFELMLIGGFGLTRYDQAPSIHDKQKAYAGWNVHARFMWHPDHLLGMGLMSGYQVFSLENVNYLPSDAPEGSTDSVTATFELSSIPVHIAFEMRPLHIRVGAGLGIYVLMSQLTENGVLTTSTDYAYGGSAWVGYEVDISESLHIGPDLVLQLLSDRGIANLSVMVVLRWDILSY